MSDVPRPFKKELEAYQEQEDKLLSMIFKKFLNSDLTETEWEAVKTIDNAMLWYDLEELLNEKQPGDPPEIHIKLDYTVRPFEEVEEEYRRLFDLNSAEKTPAFTRSYRQESCCYIGCIILSSTCIWPEIPESEKIV